MSNIAQANKLDPMYDWMNDPSAFNLPLPSVTSEKRRRIAAILCGEIVASIAIILGITNELTRDEHGHPLRLVQANRVIESPEELAHRQYHALSHMSKHLRHTYDTLLRHIQLANDDPLQHHPDVRSIQRYNATVRELQQAIEQLPPLKGSYENAHPPLVAPDEFLEEETMKPRVIDDPASLATCAPSCSWETV